MGFVYHESYDHACVNGVPGTDGRWYFDAKGVELCKACFLCEKEKLSQYKLGVLNMHGQTCVDEPINVSI